MTNICLTPYEIWSTYILRRKKGNVKKSKDVGFNPKKGQSDQEVMKALIKYREKVNLPDGLLPDYATPGFATYAEVIQEGTVTVGDTVELVA